MISFDTTELECHFNLKFQQDLEPKKVIRNEGPRHYGKRVKNVKIGVLVSQKIGWIRLSTTRQNSIKATTHKIARVAYLSA